MGFQALACVALLLSFLATTRIGQPETCERFWIVEVLARGAFLAILVPMVLRLARDRTRGAALLRTHWARALLAIAAWLVIGAVVHARVSTWGSYSSTVLTLLTAGLAMPLAIVTARRAGDRDPARFLRWATEAIALHVAVLLLLDWLTSGPPLFFEDRVHAFGLQRFQGPFRLSTTNALFTLPFFLLAQERLVSPATRSRRAAAVAIALGIGVLATFSRSAVAIVAASSLVALVRAARPAMRRRAAILVAAALAAVMAGAAALPTPWWEDLLRATRLGRADPDFLLNYRLLIWSGALEHIAAQPLLGTGDWIVPLARAPQNPHNLVLGVAYTYGLPAVALVCVPLLLYLRWPRRHRLLVVWLLLGYVFHGGFLLHLGTPWTVMMVVMGWELLDAAPGRDARGTHGARDPSCA